MYRYYCNITLAGLTSLEILDLGNNRVSDLSFVSNLTNLKEFHAGNRITDVTPLVKLPKLEYLDLNENCISDISPFLSSEKFGCGMSISLTKNPLNEKSIEEVIPALLKREKCRIFWD